MKSLFKLILLSILFSCTGYTGEYGNSFEIVMYEGYPRFEKVFTIKEDNIICVDWEHQSYLLDDSTAEQIDQMPGLGAADYYFEIKFQNETLSRVGIFSAVSSVPFDESHASIYYNPTTRSVSHDNWFIMHYLVSENNKATKKVHKGLFDKRVFNYFHQSNKLRGLDWKCNQTQIDAKNEPDSELYTKLTMLGLYDQGMQNYH